MFSPRRFCAVTAKEFVQMRRDRLTFAMMVGIPLLQLILFGYAINSDPRRLPLAVLSADNTEFSRSLVAAMRASSYFSPTRIISSRAEGAALLRDGKAQFVLTIPEQFGRQVVRGQAPVVLLEADATDPSATANAAAAFRTLATDALKRPLQGALSDLVPTPPPLTVRIHAEYNPEAVTQYNIVPGLLGVILTLTLVMITALAMTRERERGTLEGLLSTPVRPLEVMLGKIIPYIVVGYVQMFLIITAAYFLFQVPMHGSLITVLALSVIFIAANLSVGLTFSTMAKNQLQAVQLSVFFFMPSLLLSGFMFPFQGMPGWAQAVSRLLPLTHYLRFVRGVLLKGNNLAQSMTHIWPIALFLVVVIMIGLKKYRQTLD